MRRMIGVGLAAIVLLAGCNTDTSPEGSSTPSATPTAASPTAATPADLAALDKLTITGGDEEKFTLKIDGEASVSYPVVKLLREGDGEVLTDSHNVMFEGSLFDAVTGEEINTSYGIPAGRIVAVNDSEKLTPEVYEALKGQKIGAQIVWIVPASTSGSENGYIYVLQAIDTWQVKDRAEGEAVDLPEGLPEVTLDSSGKPSVKIPATAAPDKLIVQTLIKGDGPAIAPGDVTKSMFNYVTFQYTGWKWNGEQFDSSWDRDAAFESYVGREQLISAWDEGLIGQTVGSQVLIIAPPSSAYGVEGSTHELKDDTLVFVLDILSIN